MSLRKDVPVLVIFLVLFFPVALILSKRQKRWVIQHLIAVLQWCKLIDIGRCSYAQLECFGIEDVMGGRIIWGRQKQYTTATGSH